MGIIAIDIPKVKDPVSGPIMPAAIRSSISGCSGPNPPTIGYTTTAMPISAPGLRMRLKPQTGDTMTNPTASLPLPYHDFSAGFRVGWEAVHGDRVPLPRVLPMAPRLTTMGYSLFTLGVRAGVEMATGVEDLDDIDLRP